MEEVIWLPESYRNVTFLPKPAIPYLARLCGRFLVAGYQGYLFPDPPRILAAPLGYTVFLYSGRPRNARDIPRPKHHTVARFPGSAGRQESASAPLSASPDRDGVARSVRAQPFPRSAPAVVGNCSPARLGQASHGGRRQPSAGLARPAGRERSEGKPDRLAAGSGTGSLCCVAWAAAVRPVARRRGPAHLGCAARLWQTGGAPAPQRVAIRPPAGARSTSAHGRPEWHRGRRGPPDWAGARRRGFPLGSG